MMIQAKLYSNFSKVRFAVRRFCVFSVVCSICLQILVPLAIPTVYAEVPTLVTQNTAAKNWYDDYTSYYSSSKLPDTAPSAIGFSTLSSISSYDYKQDASSLYAQSLAYYSNAYAELFVLEEQRALNNIINYSTASSGISLSTGLTALDSYVPSEYAGLSEEELKWLVNNNIISRDPSEISITSTSVLVGETKPLINQELVEYIRKSDFVVALHKATYGVIESRPLVFDAVAYRKAQKVTWSKIYDYDSDGDRYLVGYDMKVGPLIDQQVSGLNTYDNSSEIFRGEFVVRLEGDEHYSVVTFPQGDKLFVTSPNVTELYLKSLIDKGIINSQNLYSNSTYNSKNVFSSNVASSLVNAFTTYGNRTTTDSYIFPSYAPELGPFEVKSGMSSVPFTPKLTVSENFLWGLQYQIDKESITFNEQDFFVIEDMLTIDALRLIEGVLRVTDGDMTDTEAMLVSYKYGANYIDTLYGDDKSTVMYMTAKGILDFDSFDEYQALYQPLTDEMAYTFLYRVANEGARKNFSQIQLTDTDNFWINAGYGSYAITVKTPNISALETFKDSAGDYTSNPSVTGTLNSVEKNHLSLFPYTETIGVTVTGVIDTTLQVDEGTTVIVERNTAQGITQELVEVLERTTNSELPADDVTIVETPNAVVALGDANNCIVEVEKSFDNPYKYLYNKKQIINGTMPATNAEKQDALLQALVNDDGSVNLEPGIKSVSYNAYTDQYKVVFEVEVPNILSATQLVDSNLESITDVLILEQQINVVSKVTASGETILLIDVDSLSKLDSNLVVVEENVLTNTLTGTRAIILTDSNIAIVGSEIIDSEEDALIVKDNNGKIYYNYDIISSLLSNSLVASIGEGDLYSLGTISSQEYKDIYGSSGDVIGKGIVGLFGYNTNLGINEAGTNTESVFVVRDFINVSQLNTASNMISKEFVRNSPSGLPVTFNVIVEWTLQLPTVSAYIDPVWAESDVNPTLGALNSYYYTRPGDEYPEQQDYWDNNIGISNALANVMYGSSNIDYIRSGYLVPNITLLFHIDSGYTIGGNSDYSNALSSDITVPIVGSWFQEVGAQLPQEWVDTFIGDATLYNKIISADVTSDDYWGKYENDVTVNGNTFRLNVNQGSIYYPDKSLNLDWFPAWVHIAFNNFEDTSLYTETSELANGTLWRNLSSNRTFNYLTRNERQSVGTVFGGIDIDDTAWMLLPSGTLYKSMNTGIYKNSLQGILAETRTSQQQYYHHIGNTLFYNGESYEVTGIHNQYLEITSTRPISGRFDAVSGTFVVVEGTEQFNILEVGYNTLKADFVGSDENVANSINDFVIRDNRLPYDRYILGTPYLIVDDLGNTKVVIYREGGSGVIYETEVSSDYYNSSAILYHPTVMLSVIGWDVVQASNTSSDSTELVSTLRYNKTIPNAVIGGAMPTSLAKTILDTMVANEVALSSASELSTGSIITVGDIHLYKLDDGVYVTTPINVGNSIGVLNLTGATVSLDELNLYAATALNVPLVVNGSICSLIDYIEEVSLGVVVDHTSFDYNNTLVSEGSNKYVPFITDGSGVEKATTSSNVQSVSFTVMLNDTPLNTTAVDKSNGVYELSPLAEEPGLSNFSSLSVFSHDFVSELVNTTIFQAFISDFMPLLNFEYRQALFLEEHDSLVKSELIYWITTLLAFSFAYLSVMCVLVFFLLKNVIFTQLAYSIKHPKGSTRNSVDIVQVLTLGMMKLDEEYSGGRLVLSIVMLLCFFAVIVTLQNNGFFFNI